MPRRVAEVLLQLQPSATRSAPPHPPRRQSLPAATAATAASCASSTESYTSRSPGIALPMCTVRVISRAISIENNTEVQRHESLAAAASRSSPGHAAAPTAAPDSPRSSQTTSPPPPPPRRILQLRRHHDFRHAALHARQHPLKQLTPQPRRPAHQRHFVLVLHLRSSRTTSGFFNATKNPPLFFAFNRRAHQRQPRHGRLRLGSNPHACFAASSSSAAHSRSADFFCDHHPRAARLFPRLRRVAAVSEQRRLRPRHRQRRIRSRKPAQQRTSGRCVTSNASTSCSAMARRTARHRPTNSSRALRIHRY